MAELKGGASDATYQSILFDEDEYNDDMASFFGEEWKTFTHQDWQDMIDQIEETIDSASFRHSSHAERANVFWAYRQAMSYLEATEEKKGSGHYNELLQDPRWIKLRNAAMNKARGKCQVCGHPATEVHHVKYKDAAGGDHLAPWNYSLKDLHPVCRACHKEAHVKQYGGCRL